MGIEGCIYCGPIADFLSAVVTIIMAFLEFKNMPKQDKIDKRYFIMIKQG
mgnify:CR=1 FL=1